MELKAELSISFFNKESSCAVYILYVSFE